MGGIIFSQDAGIAKSVYGECQAPIQMFIERYDKECQNESMIAKLFKMGTSENFGDYFTEMTGMTGFHPVGENGAYPRDSMEEGYGKLIRYVTWKDSFAISEEMMEDNKLLDLTGAPQQFMDAYHETRELFGAALFGGAMMGKKSIKFRGMEFDATGADGQNLFSTAHAPKVKGPKQSNCFSNEFSLDALDRAEAAMQVFEGENEEILTVAPDTIVIPVDPDLRRQVFAAIGSSEDPVESTHAFNYQYGRWTVISWPYLNKYLTKGKKPWMLMDSKFNEKYGGAHWIDRLKLKLTSVIEHDPGANVWYGRSRFNAGFKNWRAFACGGMDNGTDLTTLKL